MGILKKLFCSHYYVKPYFQQSRGIGCFGFLREYEWFCVKCKKTKWHEYEDIPPPSFLANANANQLPTQSEIHFILFDNFVKKNK